MKKTLFVLVLFAMFFLVLLFFPRINAATWVDGRVNDSYDGEPANGHTVMLWNPSIGMQDNTTDIIGPNGNSNRDNEYKIDCDNLNNGCNRGDTLNLRVIDTGDGYITETIAFNISQGGNTLSSLRLNSFPNFTSVLVDDSISTPANEIDLIAASTRSVVCEGIVEEYDNQSLENISAVFFGESSFYSDSDDNNSHYTNNSCFVNSSYGNLNQTKVECGFEVWYYANSENWTCIIEAEDSLSVKGNGSNNTFINTLLSIGAVSEIDFGKITKGEVTEEKIINITNYGNIVVDLGLYGYGNTEKDNLSMVCETGNISIENKKYNLTGSNPGEMSLSEFNNFYENLTSIQTIREFGLNPRTDDFENNAIKPSYWRIYVPESVGGDCRGNIVLGAEQL